MINPKVVTAIETMINPKVVTTIETMINTPVLAPIEVVEKPKVFSAVGLLEGDLIFTENQVVVRTGGIDYPLFYSNVYNQRALFNRLAKTSQHLNKTILVYPQVRYPLNGEPIVGFILVAVKNSSDDVVFKDFKLNQFKLTGIWQWMLKFKTPVVSVYRNRSSEMKNSLIKMLPSTKTRVLKPQHIPLIWHDPIINPWRYGNGSEVKSDKYLVSILARFDTQTGVFYFEALADLPTTNIPGYYTIKKPDTRQKKKPESTTETPRPIVKKKSTSETPRPIIKPKSKPEKPKLKKLILDTHQ